MAQRLNGWSYSLFLPSAVSAYLAYWQLERMKEKENKLRGVAEQAGHEAVPVFSALDLQEDQPVSAEGLFDSEHYVLLGPRPRSIGGATRLGYILFQPLHDNSSGQAVLVNRGWIPKDWDKSRDLIDKSTPIHPTKVVGVVQSSESPSMFVPRNNPSSGTFFWVDAPKMAEACGLPASTPLIQVIRREQPSYNSLEPPIPKSLNELGSFPTMPFGHAVYAFTWASLSVSCAYLALRAVKAKRA